MDDPSNPQSEPPYPPTSSLKPDWCRATGWCDPRHCTCPDPPCDDVSSLMNSLGFTTQEAEEIVAYVNQD